MTMLSRIITRDSDFKYYENIGADILEEVGFNFPLYTSLTSASLSQKKSRNLTERRKQLLNSKYFVEGINEFVREWNDIKTIKFDLSTLNSHKDSTIEYLAREPTVTMKDYNNINKTEKILGNLNVTTNIVGRALKAPKQVWQTGLKKQIYHIIQPENAHFMDKHVKWAYQEKNENDVLERFVYDLIRTNPKVDLSEKLPFEIYTAIVGAGYISRKFEIKKN